MEEKYSSAKARALAREEESIAEMMWVAAAEGRGSVRSVTNKVAIRPAPLSLVFY